MKRTILSLGVGTLVVGALLLAGCECCQKKPECKPACYQARCSTNAGWRQRDGSSFKRCPNCRSQMKTYNKDGKTWTKCTKCSS
jgi:uncharacterized C2H2 Zn-finger protein